MSNVKVWAEMLKCLLGISEGCTFDSSQNLNVNNMDNGMILKFGKYKGQRFKDTPKSYQNWLMRQDWFRKNTPKRPLHQQLRGWDGYSKRGQAILEQIFENEVKMDTRQDCLRGICTCCEGSMYYGI